MGRYLAFWDWVLRPFGKVAWRNPNYLLGVQFAARPTMAKTATQRLIELAERLRPTGEIGDGMVAEFHAAAKLARLEAQQPTLQALFAQDLRYEGPYIVINCGTHSSAIAMARRARGELGIK